MKKPAPPHTPSFLLREKLDSAMTPAAARAAGFAHKSFVYYPHEAWWLDNTLKDYAHAGVNYTLVNVEKGREIWRMAK